MLIFGVTNVFLSWANAITIGLVLMYILANIGVVKYYLTEGRAQFNPLLHVIVPVIGRRSQPIRVSRCAHASRRTAAPACRGGRNGGRANGERCPYSMHTAGVNRCSSSSRPLEPMVFGPCRAPLVTLPRSSVLSLLRCGDSASAQAPKSVIWLLPRCSAVRRLKWGAAASWLQFVNDLHRADLGRAAHRAHGQAHL